MRPSPLRHPARLAGASLLRLQSDARLAELAVDGHQAAFAAIVDRYRTPLARYCAGIVGPNRAEDAVQQALINAHDALQRTDEVRHLRSWLYRIAHNASLNVLRAVRDDVSLEDAERSGSLGGGRGQGLDDDGPAATFERSERFRATVAALQELPERQRAALVLRELEGRSHQEIADALGVTKGSARQHLMRARTAVRGAVTAVTPYPRIVRLAEALTAPGGAAWSDAAVGAGATATLAKLTAGIAATGALVGGAVGTEHVVHHRGGGASAAAATREAGSAAHKAASGATGTVRRIVVSQAATALPAAASGTHSSSGGAPHHPGKPSGGHGPSGSSPGSGSNSGSNDDDSGHDGSRTTSHRGRDDSGDTSDDATSSHGKAKSHDTSSDDGHGDDKTTTSSGKGKHDDETTSPTTSSSSGSGSHDDTTPAASGSPSGGSGSGAGGGGDDSSAGAGGGEGKASGTSGGGTSGGGSDSTPPISTSGDATPTIPTGSGSGDD
ncbi:MAG: sigma-70 family polymerase sigma factor [Conexibacter sp.]|nr:sigma-70 family polymerase sigma factor [Conexibacter sp.]